VFTNTTEDHTIHIQDHKAQEVTNLKVNFLNKTPDFLSQLRMIQLLEEVALLIGILAPDMTIIEKEEENTNIISTV
jgi:Holliday junction resolvasome RuvABC endonuclease subunit